MAKHKKIDILSQHKQMKIKLKGLSSDISKSDMTGCKIELRFNREAIIDDCRGVAQYSDTRISLNVKGGLIIFEGSGLTLYSFDESTATVRGVFTNIGFEV